MAKTKVSEWSSTPASNTEIDGVNISEGCAPSGINNAIREMMAQIKDFQAGTSGDMLAVLAGGAGGTMASLQRERASAYFFSPKRMSARPAKP
jgi:hypothetical protein